MSLWKLTTRKTKKVSSGADEEVGLEEDHRVFTDEGGNWVEPLPDVIANLHLSDPSDLRANAEMLGVRDYHYPEVGEGRVRRRDARPPPPPVSPQGLGAAPQGLGAGPGPAMASATVGGGGNTGASGIGAGGGCWRHSSQQYQWASQPQADAQGLSPMSSGMGLGATCTVPAEAEGARLRSVSSEPRGPAGNGGDRRVRCSSASRSRQHRPCPPPGERPSGMASIPPPNSPPPPQASGSHAGSHQPYSSPSSVSPPSAGGAGVAGGVFARLAGCYENLDPGRDSGESGGGAYGYQVSDLEALLTRASPSHPANLPMVLASSTRLHNMRRTPEPSTHNQTPVRPFLPLGIIVNAVFKTRDWLYVRTAHGAEGYVPYRVCLPLGILPPPREGHAMPPGAPEMSGDGVWESRTDNFAGAGPGQLPIAQVTQGAMMSGVSPEAASQTRGRSRGRRRHPCSDNCNQTDTQKLQPRGRSVSESRPPRETLDAPGSGPPGSPDHVLV
ncbi:uncharacterized protein [Macrobrachium rosenbergii]|uniref:uncharacterized protein isoform X1 n=2 Tax=Macrobrachium rosenbergii TaxID=79674 RepID=UPI0034D3F924